MKLLSSLLIVSFRHYPPDETLHKIFLNCLSVKIRHVHASTFLPLLKKLKPLMLRMSLFKTINRFLKRKTWISRNPPIQGRLADINNFKIFNSACDWSTTSQPGFDWLRACSWATWVFINLKIFRMEVKNGAKFDQSVMAMDIFKIKSPSISLIAQYR